MLKTRQTVLLQTQALAGSSGLKLDYSVSALLVQDSVATVPASDYISCLELVLCATVPTYVAHSLFWGLALHGSTSCRC